MFLVALLPPSASSEGDATRLAAALGCAAYDARLHLSATVPRVIARMASRVAAEAHAGALVRAGFAAIVCDGDAVVAAEQMVQARAPVVSPAGLWANGVGTELLPWPELAALVHARSVTEVERTRRERVVRNRNQAGSPMVEYERTSHESLQQNVLYIFPRAGRPWFATEHAVRYTALGEALRPTHRENFLALLARLRAAAPRTPFDDRLVRAPPPRVDAIAIRGEGTPEHAGPGRALDLAACLVARAIARHGTTPFRTPGMSGPP